MHTHTHTHTHILKKTTEQQTFGLCSWRVTSLPPFFFPLHFYLDVAFFLSSSSSSSSFILITKRRVDFFFAVSFRSPSSRTPHPLASQGRRCKRMQLQQPRRECVGEGERTEKREGLRGVCVGGGGGRESRNSQQEVQHASEWQTSPSIPPSSFHPSSSSSYPVPPFLSVSQRYNDIRRHSPLPSAQFIFFYPKLVRPPSAVRLTKKKNPGSARMHIHTPHAPHPLLPRFHDQAGRACVFFSFV